ncbi:MAG: M48 family metallopeptidase [Chloroflexi bacterium]|nr:M48 family metallopeptidase [Chloroflexota bacterium]
METAELDLNRQKKAKEYSRISRRLMLVDLALTGIYALVWLLLGWSAGLRGWLEGFTNSPWLLVALFALIFGGIYSLIDLPLSYYSGFVLPHRFGQSNQTLKGWISDQVKSLLVNGVIGLLLLEVVYAVLRAFPDTWWVWAAALMLLFSVVFSTLAPVLLMPIFYKFVPLGEEHADLVARLKRLFEQAGTQVKGVYRFDMSRRTKSANAALTGLGSTRRIILGDTLLDEFTADEIETVLAHELGHHVNRDIPLLILSQTLTTVLGLFFAHLALRWGVGQFGFQGVGDIAALPLFMLVMGVFGLVTMPLGNALSRWRERMADQYALDATQNPRAFASAMTRLANQNLAEVDPEPWVEFLLYSHPALEKRIMMANRYAEKARAA